MTATVEGIHAVFYRNLNLGHRRSPTREQLEGAWIRAGAVRARSFQTNGTGLLVADDPEAVVSKAAEDLAEMAGYVGAAMVRTVSSLREVLADDHFAGRTDHRTYAETFTFFDGGRPPSWALPWTNQRDTVDFIHVTDGLTLGIIRKPNSSPGNPTSEVERETGGVATTRTKGTLERLVNAATAW